MLLITESDVRRLLPMSECIRLMREAFSRMASGEAVNQPRRRLSLASGSALHYMAASDGKYFGTKIYSTHPVHGAHFLFLLYRAADAELLALFEANYLGQIRTGAASGLATDLMASRDASTAAIIGSGFQARTQVAAIRAVRNLKTVRVWSRSPESREAFAAECGAEAADTAEQAVRGAEIVVTATSAKEPVIESAWISAGAHINAMGSNQAKRRELPADLVERADWLVVDSVEQARKESGDLLLASEEVWHRVTELRDVVCGQVRIRTNAADLTIFKSNGIAVEDVISAGYVYERALIEGAGRPLYS